jgi:hypothetical protein
MTENKHSRVSLATRTIAPSYGCDSNLLYYPLVTSTVKLLYCPYGRSTVGDSSNLATLPSFAWRSKLLRYPLVASVAKVTPLHAYQGVTNVIPLHVCGGITNVMHLHEWQGITLGFYPGCTVSIRGNYEDI